jgi:hypothetical protein
MGHPADPAVFTEYARILVPTDRNGRETGILGGKLGLGG